MLADRCTAHYERPGGRQSGDRSVKCHLEAGHPGEHEEEGTEVTWLPDEPDVESKRAALAQAIDDHERFREQALADPATREAYIKARVDAAYQRGLAEGRRQATEGWEREWSVQYGDGPAITGGSFTEASAKAAASDTGGAAVWRLATRWETAEQPEDGS